MVLFVKWSFKLSWFQLWPEQCGRVANSKYPCIWTGFSLRLSHFFHSLSITLRAELSCSNSWRVYFIISRCLSLFNWETFIRTAGCPDNGSAWILSSVYECTCVCVCVFITCVCLWVWVGLCVREVRVSECGGARFQELFSTLAGPNKLAPIFIPDASVSVAYTGPAPLCMPV